MRFIWILIPALVLVVSCQTVEEPRKPDDLISEEKMVEVLTDLAILNSAKNFNRRQLEEIGIRPDTYLYEMHSIDSIQLARSTEYYAKEYERIERIYARVKDNLEEIKTDLEKIRDEEQRVKDSLELEKQADTIPELRKTEDTLSDTLILPDPPEKRVIE